MFGYFSFGFNPIRSFIARKSQLSSALTNKVSTQRDLFVAKLSIHFFPCFAFRDFCFAGGRRTGFPLAGFLGGNGGGRTRLRRRLVHIFEYVSIHSFNQSSLWSFDCFYLAKSSVYLEHHCDFVNSGTSATAGKLNSTITKGYKKILGKF